MKKSSYPASAGIDAYWQAEDDMRTLARAEEIRSNKKRLAAAKACAKTKMAEMAKVIGKK